MGRPKKENSKELRFNLRMDSETYDQLVYLAWTTGLPESEILRQGIRIQYHSAKNPRY